MKFLDVSKLQDDDKWKLTAEFKPPAEFNKTDVVGLHDRLQGFVVQGVVIVLGSLEDGWRLGQVHGASADDQGHTAVEERGLALSVLPSNLTGYSSISVFFVEQLTSTILVTV